MSRCHGPPGSVNGPLNRKHRGERALLGVPPGRVLINQHKYGRPYGLDGWVVWTTLAAFVSQVFPERCPATAWVHRVLTEEEKSHDQ